MSSHTVIPHGLSGRQAAEERAVRWQYLFHKSQLFDNTPTGWHSIEEPEAALLEQHHQSQAEAPLAIHSPGSGYDYTVDLRRMTQRNTSTGKVRDLRRVELALNRVAVQGGHRHCLDVDLAQGETIEWFYEVQGGAKVAFQACFVPSRGDISTIRMHKATWPGLADDFSAPKAGRARFMWDNSFKTASPRVVLFQCKVIPSVSAASTDLWAHDRGEEAVPQGAVAGVASQTMLPSLESFLRQPLLTELDAGSPADTTAPSTTSSESGSEPSVGTVAGSGARTRSLTRHHHNVADLAPEHWEDCGASNASGDLSEWEVVNVEPAC